MLCGRGAMNPCQSLLSLAPAGWSPACLFIQNLNNLVVGGLSNSMIKLLLESKSWSFLRLRAGVFLTGFNWPALATPAVTDKELFRYENKPWFYDK